ncbi:calcium-activated chloride channel regulator 4A-like [Apostichopus japonicus]|uniref:calcium-activated chloride channel regulator 4A-like n=1 Tax=Stichopus japonicus TaxID=307972 RepID=UPI003AB30477
MTSDRRRNNLANLVPEDANGNTCIGCGLDKAIKVLKAHGDPEGGKILLMTDCMDGDGESTQKALKKVIEKKVTIDIVAITDAEISQNIENLATKTGGQLYLQTDDSTSTGAREAANANAGMPSVFETRVEIESSVVVFDKDDLFFEGSVYIDETIGRLTTFDFTYFHTNPSGEAAVFITIMSPGERTFDRFQASYENDLAFKKVKIRIPGIAEPGEWTYHIYNQDTTVKHDVIVSVASYPSEEGVDPITVSSFVCGSLIGVVDNKPLVIYAEVKKRFDPVIGVKVIATVERPNADPVRLILLDNGAGADLTKNDGIYSKSFSQVLGVGLYGIKIRIENNGGAKILPYRSSLHSGTGIYLEPELLLSGNITEYLGNISIELPGAPIPEIAGVPAPNFTRGVSGGASSVSELPPEWNPSIDTFAPNKITDLAVFNTSFSMGTVAITFTASGDDFDFGNAHHYVIRWADSSQELRNKASTTNEIYQTDVLHGNLNSPAPYGDEEIMIIQVATVPQHLETYSVVLGLYAVDESDNEGDMSNTAKATFRKVIPTPEPIQTTTRTPTTETEDQSCKYLYHPFLGVFLSGDCED